MVTILHFQPIERYPPIQNTLIELVNNFQIDVISMQYRNDATYKLEGVTFKRSFIRKISLLNHLSFFLNGLIHLLVKRPKTILVYEHYSFLPVHIYSAIFRSSKIFIHFHEYTSSQERKSASKLLKLIYRIEKKMIKKAKWISHTNEDRAKLYSRDMSIGIDSVRVFPNYPPRKWYETSSCDVSKPIKLVQVGALGIESTYIKEILDFVSENQSNYTLTIFSNNLDIAVLELIKEYNLKNVIIKEPISYSELPEVLKLYHVGLVLYNGNSVNYVYNLPNKVLEYASCGLEVWYSADLISTKKFHKANQAGQLVEVDFRNGTYPVFLGRDDRVKLKNLNSYEANKPIINQIKREI